MIDRVNGTDWDAYSMECVNDLPGPALPLFQLFSEYEIPFIIASGRSECAREVTIEWLHKHNVYPWAIYLSDSRHDYMPHGEWKAIKLMEIQEELGVKIRLHVEDHSSVAEALALIGIPCMLVHDTNKLAEMLG